MKVMDHRIVNEPLKFFKSAARMELKGRWLEAAVASGIYVIIVGIVGFIVESLFPTLSFITGIYTLIIFGPAVVGLYAYFMRIVRRQPFKLAEREIARSGEVGLSRPAALPQHPVQAQAVVMGAERDAGVRAAAQKLRNAVGGKGKRLVGIGPDRFHSFSSLWESSGAIGTH